MKKFKDTFGWFKTKPGRRSTNDWLLFILIMLILLAISLTYHFFLFFNVEIDSSASASTVTTHLETLDRDALKKTVDYLQTKKGTFVGSASPEPVATTTTISLPSLGQ